jgi:hypothetical protein
VIIVSFGALAAIDSGKSFLPYWVRWNYRGYEDTTGDYPTPPKQYGEYRAFINAAAKLPPGRLLWEGNSQLNVYGSPLALMLLPYWTHGRISSMEGVYYEASATTPYQFMTVAALVAPGNASNPVGGVPYRNQSDFKLGVRWMQQLGVNYFAAHSPQAEAAADADPRLKLVATSPDRDGIDPLGWRIYRVAHSELVEPVRYQPVVVDHVPARDEQQCERKVALLLSRPSVQVHDWQDCIAVPWFNDTAALNRPLVADGPSSWQHSGPAAARSLPKKRLPNVRVTNVRADTDSVSFDVSRTGVPVYVKTSFFPNWEASGANGPYRATPDAMVVVPTSRHVTLHYGTTGTEWLGRAGTLAGVGGLIALVVIPRRRRKRTIAVPMDAHDA